MEKLINLINEYKKLNGGREVCTYKEEEHLFVNDTVINLLLDDVYAIGEEEIICKRYGFIGWLVKNDKIDLKKVEPCFYDNNTTIYGESDIRSYNDYDNVLMQLAISDNPIELLISMLKEDKKSDFEDLVDRNIDVAKRLASK